MKTATHLEALAEVKARPIPVPASIRNHFTRASEPELLLAAVLQVVAGRTGGTFPFSSRAAAAVMDVVDEYVAWEAMRNLSTMPGSWLVKVAAGVYNPGGRGSPTIWRWIGPREVPPKPSATRADQPGRQALVEPKHSPPPPPRPEPSAAGATSVLSGDEGDGCPFTPGRFVR